MDAVPSGDARRTPRCPRAGRAVRPVRGQGRTPPPCARAGPPSTWRPTWSYGSPTPSGPGHPGRRPVRLAGAKLMDRAWASGYEALVGGLRSGPPPSRGGCPACAAAEPERVVRAPRGRAPCRRRRPPGRPARPRRRPVGGPRAHGPVHAAAGEGRGVALEAPGFGEVPARGDGPGRPHRRRPQELVLFPSAGAAPPGSR